MWVNGSCYRINHGSVDDLDQRNNGGFQDVPDEYEDEVGCGMENNPEISDCRYMIEDTNNGLKFKASFHVASAFFPIMIGKKGTTKKRIETDTKTRISIPKQGIENEDIVITGESRFSVAMACNRIDSIVASSRQKQGFTHFLSIPCNTKAIQNSFGDFKEKVVKLCDDKNIRGVDETVFQTPSLLHMTIGTLALMDEVERQKAKEILENAMLEIAGDKPINFEISGLEIMNDDPSEVDVVYAKVQNDELQNLATELVNKFSETGLMPRQFDRVKLHVTVLNTLFRKESDDLGPSSTGQGVNRESNNVRETLDARPLLKHFGDFQFGSLSLKEIHLSQRRAGKRSKENYYFPSAIVRL